MTKKFVLNRPDKPVGTIAVFFSVLNRARRPDAECTLIFVVSLSGRRVIRKSENLRMKIRMQCISRLFSPVSTMLLSLNANLIWRQVNYLFFINLCIFSSIGLSSRLRTPFFRTNQTGLKGKMGVAEIKMHCCKGVRRLL